MQTVKLDVKSYTNSGGVHANLIIGGSDAGVLYLDEKERELLMSLLREGAAARNDVIVDELLPDDEVDIDIFDD